MICDLQAGGCDSPARWHTAEGFLYERLDLSHRAAEVPDNVQHRIGREVPLLPERHQHLPVPLLHLQSSGMKVSVVHVLIQKIRSPPSETESV